MKLSQATSKKREIDVEFDGGAVLKVTYSPLTYTVREMDEAAKDAGNTNRIIDTMKRLVQSWDLTDEAENVIPLDHPLVEVTEEVEEDGETKVVGTGKFVPADDDPLRDVPTHIFTEILAAVGKDQAPSPEASRPSRGR